MSVESDSWWESAVLYQVYLRSFADGNNDGSGDIAGLRDRLPYIRSLGVKAIWVSPWYPSPMCDGGYDVADYQNVDPLFGNLQDAAALFHDAHALGLRVLVDIVPNHTSSQHPWFLKAINEPEGGPAREMYYFRDGKGPDGTEPPNNWSSAFGGPAWTRTVHADGSAGQWYLHLFAPEQPDLNWNCPQVRAEFEAILRFWSDLGADGFRLDAVPAIGKDSGLPDASIQFNDVFSPSDWPETPLWDGEIVHEVVRLWRAVARSYQPERVLLGEVIVNSPSSLARYLRGDELHSAFAFELARAPWSAKAFRTCVDDVLGGPWTGSARPTWVLSSHDEVRPVTRLASSAQGSEPLTEQDLALGTARARAAVLLMLALPGSACMYQGEELGLWQVDDLPPDILEDPIVAQTGDALKGRDGCRVPLPWAGEKEPFGFSKSTPPWLPQPSAWADLTVEHQERSQGSTLQLVREAIALRSQLPELACGQMRWLTSKPDVVGFDRGTDFVCLVNFDASPVAIPDGYTALLSSGPLTRRGQLPVNTTAWLKRQAPVPEPGRQPGVAVPL